MTTANQFSNYYKSISNAELLNILNHPGDYQPLAIEAAKKEFSDRQLSEKDIKDARQLLIDKQLQKQKQKEKIKAVENKIIASGNTLVDTLNPIQQSIPSTEKTIRWIVIIFGGLFLYQFIKDFKLHIIYVKDIPAFPIDSILYLSPIILLPISIFTFWKRIKIGWFLLAIFLVYSAVVVLWALMQTLLLGSTNSVLDNILPRPTVLTLTIQLIFFGE